MVRQPGSNPHERDVAKPLILEISSEAVVQLSEHPNIIAIMESSGYIEKAMKMVRQCRPGFQVLVGRRFMVGAADDEVTASPARSTPWT